jgi:hypothetical protein
MSVRLEDRARHENLIMRQPATVLVMLVLATVPQQAASQVLRGRVVDHASSAVLSDVHVRLIDDTGRETGRTTSDASGIFQLRAPGDGRYRVQASLIGYETAASDALAIGRHETVELLIRLSVDPVQLTPIVVTTRHDGSRLAEFERRRELRLTGHFITREEIERRPIATAAELLIGIPAVTLTPMSDGGGVPQDRYILGFRSRTPDHCTAHLFINGTEVMQTPTRTVDDLLIGDWIGGIEIYPSAALAPVEYRRADPCGVVLYWTRDAEPGTSWGWIKLAAATAFAGLAFILTR